MNAHTFVTQNYFITLDEDCFEIDALDALKTVSFIQVIPETAKEAEALGHAFRVASKALYAKAKVLGEFEKMAKESLERGIQDVKDGSLVDRGSFAKEKPNDIPPTA